MTTTDNSANEDWAGDWGDDPATGASIWWRDHADHHMPALMDPDGVFHGVKDTNNRDEPLPYTELPAGLFPDERVIGR